MKKLIKLSTACLLLNAIAVTAFAHSQEMIKHGIYAGLGGSWNTIDETFNSTFLTSSHNSAWDHYAVNLNRLAPMVQVGYWAPICNPWLWGVEAQWKYLGYKTPNVNTSRGQYIQNASFSSINIFGDKVIRDFTSQTKIDNEVLLLLYFGMQLQNGYAYLGLGPTLFTATNNIYVSSVHTAMDGGDNLSSNSVNSSKTMWGGAAQVGYNYYFASTCFLNLNYTYSKSGTYHFNNTVNAATLNAAGVPGPTTVNLNRKINFGIQEVMFSINKVFEI